MKLYQIISRLLQATVLIIFILAAVLPYVAAWTTQAAASTADFAADDRTFFRLPPLLRRPV